MRKDETETIIRWDMDAQEVTIYSCQPAIWRKCRRAGWQLVAQTHTARGRVWSEEYRAPLAQFRFTCVPASRLEKERLQGLRMAKNLLMSPKGA